MITDGYDETLSNRLIKVYDIEYITRMYADILFDRDIEPDKHHISPGGYEIIARGLRSLSFDFMWYYGYIDETNKRVLHIEERYVDKSSFPEAAKDLIKVVETIDHFSEFYIYTGEENEPEIYPVEISNVSFETNLDRRISIDNECLSKVNKNYQLATLIENEKKGIFHGR